MKQYVLITGATSGIGYEFAKIFAENNYNLIISGRNIKVLQNMKERMEEEYKIMVYIFEKDLSKKGSAEELYKEIKNNNINIDILINNAGFGYVNEFIKEGYDKDEEMMNLNMNSLTVLTKLCGREMAERKQGKILNVASTGAYHPGPYTAVYYATKAYVLSLTEAVAHELKPYNVTVTALCPGATKTNFCKREGKEDNPKAKDPSFVAKKGYEALMKGKGNIIPGIENKLLVMLPRKIVAPFIGKYQMGLKKKHK
ncbi:MAG: SDR family oxidoreductase [Clostridium butyricum]|nr:SDR family oxidoreductase [Clostridium butyricum]